MSKLTQLLKNYYRTSQDLEFEDGSFDQVILDGAEQAIRDYVDAKGVSVEEFDPLFTSFKNACENHRLSVGSTLNRTVLEETFDSIEGLDEDTS